MNTLDPRAEYVIRDIYLPTMKGNARTRGDMVFRTDSRGRVWIKGVGSPEQPYMARWCAEHPRLEKIRNLDD